MEDGEMGSFVGATMHVRLCQDFSPNGSTETKL